MSNPNVAFTLRIRLYTREHDSRLITITAYDDQWSMQGTHGRVDLEVRHGSTVVFPRGVLWIGIPKGLGHGSDSLYAKEAAMSCVAIKPGDTDDEHFSGYTPEQLAWVTEHGEALDIERESRYSDEKGSVRKSA